MENINSQRNGLYTEYTPLRRCIILTSLQMALQDKR